MFFEDNWHANNPLINYFMIKEFIICWKGSQQLHLEEDNMLSLPSDPNSLVTLLKMCLGYKTKD